jgi:hypothetical protein
MAQLAVSATWAIQIVRMRGKQGLSAWFGSRPCIKRLRALLTVGSEVNTVLKPAGEEEPPVMRADLPNYLRVRQFRSARPGDVHIQRRVGYVVRLPPRRRAKAGKESSDAHKAVTGLGPPLPQGRTAFFQTIRVLRRVRSLPEAAGPSLQTPLSFARTREVPESCRDRQRRDWSRFVARWAGISSLPGNGGRLPRAGWPNRISPDGSGPGAAELGQASPALAPSSDRSVPRSGRDLPLERVQGRSRHHHWQAARPFKSGGTVGQ